MADDAVAQALGSRSTTIRQALSSQSLTRRMDQARYSAQQARTSRGKRGSR
jgi:hypothetical protein